MPTAIVKTATLIGVEACMIDVEADVHMGLGAFNIVGLPDGAIKESKDRISSALKNGCGGFPIRRIIINLAPADIKKMGTGFDLPIAVAILKAFDQLPENAIQSDLLIGELALDGRIKPIPGILAVALAARENGIQRLIVPKENATQASLVEGLEVLCASHIKEVFDHYSFIKNLPIVPKASFNAAVEDEVLLDFSDVKGQQTAKRVLEIAASGQHNVLFSGPPGSGKSMLSKRMPSILPSLSFQESLDTTKIHSISNKGALIYGLLSQRPFRSPHHSVSGAGLIGGGTFPKPGEVSLAHNGVLFLDELTEFSRHTLDLLRQPMEEKVVNIARANITLKFPSDFILLAAMNPCLCGYLGDSNRECSCSMGSILKYRSKISGPLLDRIDLQSEMLNMTYEELNFSQKGETSHIIRERVLLARDRQLNRFNLDATHNNSNMSHGEVEKYCQLDKSGHQLLKHALTKYKLSARAHDSILKVSRTIADLEGAKLLQSHHLAEAITYRCLDKEISF
jgi:magnesium chelatase family protein